MNTKITLRSWLESLAFAVAFLPVAIPAFAEDAPFATELVGIQQSWDEANYHSANAEEK